MSAVDDFRNGLYGNPPTDEFKPDRAVLLTAFTELYTQATVAIAASQANITTVATTTDRNTFYADPDNQSKLVYVNNNNGSAADPANGVYEYVDGAPRLAEGFYQGLALIVKPLVDQARDAVNFVPSVVEPLTTSQAIGREVAPITGTGIGNTPFIHATPITRDSWLESMSLFALTAGTIKIQVWSRDGITNTRLNEYSVDVNSGAVNLTRDDFGFIPISAGSLIGVYAPNILAYTAETADGGGEYYDTTSPGNVGDFDQASPSTSVRLQWGFVLAGVSVSEARMAAAEADIGDVAERLSESLVSTIGRSAANPPSAGTDNLGAANYAIFVDPVPMAGPPKKLRIQTAAADTVYIDRNQVDGSGNRTLVASYPVAVAAGYNEIDTSGLDIPFVVGEYIGIHAAAHSGLAGASVIRYSATTAADGAGWWYPAAAATTVGTPYTTLRLEVGFEWDEVDLIDVSALKAKVDGLTGGDALSTWAAVAREEAEPRTATALPTVTVGANGAASAITGSANASVGIAATSALVARVGGTFSAQSDASYQAAVRGGGRIRFIHTGRRFEARFRFDSYQRPPTIKIDGERVTDPLFAGMDINGNHLVLVDYGANTETYTPVTVASIGAGGSGYAIGDIITNGAGTFRVTNVSSGAVTAAMPVSKTALSAVPSQPIAQTATSGAGTGCTLNVNFAKRETTTKTREVEITLDQGCWFGGLNVDSSDTVVPRAENKRAPKLCIVGDSIARGAFSDHADSMYPFVIARKLGLSERFVKLGTDGMGWAVSGNAFSAIQSAASAEAADVYVVCLGVNDQTHNVTTAAVTAAVTSGIGAIMAANPKAIFALVTGFEGQDGSYTNTTADFVAAITAGAAALSNQDRVRVVDITTAYKIYLKTGAATGVPFRSTPDGLHPGEPGHYYIGSNTAPLIRAALIDMINSA